MVFRILSLKAASLLFFAKKAGVYIKFEIHIFAPPPFLIYIFSPTEIYYNVQPFFCNFVYFKSIGEKICIVFSNWGKNFSPFFHLFQSFFIPNLLFGHIDAPPPGGGGQTEKHTPLQEGIICYICFAKSSMNLRFLLLVMQANFDRVSELVPPLGCWDPQQV